ncbi:LOW QUALITY PROTEIN: cilia- and flagella-associated protein 74 [Ciconia maguari]
MEENKISYSEEEEQKSLLPFLEEKEKEGKAGQFSNVEEHWEEYKPEEELAGGGKTGNKDASEGVQDKSDSSMESLEHYLGDINNIQAMKYTDRLCILTLQRNLKELNDIAKQKELAVQKARDKLSTCQLQIKVLAKQLEYVDIEIEKEEEAGNVAALSRLQAMHRRLCTELEKEKDFELKMALTLKENMLEMWQIETEQGKYEILREQLKKDEEELEMQYQERAQVRIWKEKIAALQAEENWRSREKKEEEAQKEYEERHKKVVEDAKRNHEKAVCFLRKSMARIHEKNAKEEVKTREHMERRIQAVLSLKTSITSNRAKLQTLQVWNKAMAFEAKKQEMKMREAILAEGGNVAKEIFLRKRLLEHEKEKQASREQQKSRKIEIVSRILQEKASILKQKKSQSCTKAIKGGGKLEDSSLWRMKTWRYIEKTCKHSAGAISQPWCSSSACSSAGERTASVGEISEKIPHDVLCESGEDEKERDKTLVEPEFPGLWSQECDLRKISKEETELKQLATRVKEKGTFEKKMEEFQTGIFHKQMVSGRECKGRTFYSKPSCIHFKDFDVGQIYKKKIVLTNASYSVNFCRLVGMSDWLKDFISIHFDPPGKMSAGMSCEIVVTFKPMINETLEGEVMFMAQTGSFSVPLKCTAKRCMLALDKELIDFGSHVVGETISRTISLTNSGALGTRFKVQMSAGDSRTCRATAKSSPRRMVTQHFSDCVPEKEVSNSPVTSVAEKKEQICADHSEEMTYCVAQVEQHRTETSLSSSSAEQVGQDVLNSRSHLDTDSACNLVELSPEETPVEIMLGKVTEGEIGPFSSVKLQIIFVPAIPGDVRAEFVIMFDNADCKPLCFSAIGVSIDVPVWVPNPNVDLKICMYDRLYQDCIVIQSRAKVTLRLKFEVCKELSKHMELLPKTGYIQAQSSFSVQLKFLPRCSLPEDAGSYFNEETRVLEVPVTILIVDKMEVFILCSCICFRLKKVNFTVHGNVTTSDLEISPARINFGYCTIYEAVQGKCHLTNKSILPQEFGFVGLPEFVEIQPNDGLGILLPLESLTLDIIFKANETKEYSFELTCKSEINRQFKLSCKAVGVHPPLELSHSLVQFAATALNGVSTATLYVMNSHVSVNLYHAVPRIGNEVAPVGPTSFEFRVPEDCPVTITPSVGTVLPGKVNSLQISFRPTLSDQLIREEAVRRLCRAAATGAEIQILLDFFFPLSFSLTKMILIPGFSSSDTYMAAQAFLMRNFSGRFEKYIIPCFVASGHIDEKKGSENLSCRPRLQEGGCQLRGGGCLPFSMWANTDILLAVFSETLDIRTAKTTLTLSNHWSWGDAIIVCSVEEGLNMGYVIAREKVTSTFKGKSFCAEPESTSAIFGGRKRSSVVSSLAEQKAEWNTERITGLSGVQASFQQKEKFVACEESGDLFVTFQSVIKRSLYYSDRLKVVLFGQAFFVLHRTVAHVIHLKGAARDHPMFVEGGIPLDVPIESLAVTSPVSSPEALKGELQEPVKSILLVLEYIEGEGSPVPAMTELKVGAIQTARFASKKNVEFSFDSLPLLQQKGFTVESVKGTVEPGQVKCISVSWVPPADFSCKLQLPTACCCLTWKRVTAVSTDFAGAIQKLILKMSAVQAALPH